jgi:hypothetical protein
MKAKTIKDDNRIISIAPAAPGTVAVYACDEGEPDFETPVLAWGVVDRIEDGFNYTSVVPLEFDGDTNTLVDCGDCDNYLGVRGGPLGDNRMSIENNRHRYKERREKARVA